MSITVDVVGRIAPVRSGAVLSVLGGGPVLALPWWPDDVEYSDMAPGYTDTDRPGRTALGTRSAEPLTQLRLAFTLSGRTFTQSAQAWTDALDAIAKAKPLVHVALGSSDRGTWQVREAGYVETAHTDDGTVASADAIILLRRPSDALIPIGPVRPKRPRQ